MIRFVRTASIAPGKFADALAFAKEISEYMGKKYSLKLEVMMPVGGNPQRIAWRAEYASLGAFEEIQSKIVADKKYWEIVSKGTTHFIAGSLNDNIWRTV
jgi:hypothetical protein